MTQAVNAYTTHQRGGESVRDTEAHALFSCANKLEAAQRADVSREDFYAAVRNNQDLWTVFQVCLCEPDNPLPSDLKTLLLNLSHFVDKTSFKALSSGDKGLLGSLISINRNIAAGLAVKPNENERASAASNDASTPVTLNVTSA